MSTSTKVPFLVRFGINWLSSLLVIFVLAAFGWAFVSFVVWHPVLFQLDDLFTLVRVILASTAVFSLVILEP